MQYTADCRTVNKPGECPPLNLLRALTERNCRRECNDDADCLGVGKCCVRGCSQLCMEPTPATTSAPTNIYNPGVPQAPQPSEEREPEVRASEGGVATLRCLFHGNPPPLITWRRNEITINGDVGRYRLLSDGALEIVSLYRNDSGVYICIANNELGSATQEVTLHVDVPVTTRINAERTQVVAGSEIRLACDVDGYPEPRVQWTKDRMQLTATDRIQITETRLTIFRAQSNDSGEYSCEAANEYTSHSSVINVTVKGIYIPPTCVDNPYFADCHLIIRSNYCRHKYYSKFCCKSCVEAGQLEAEEAELMQADMSFRRKK
ncbi:papilin-like isoform X3 [Leptidea sinapis]|uniref:papilin-like isoform X3 n=1 Tax=Leptidea sinapis TaxID=189913 RepID=UPI0021C2603D|nr:papilin-like isoform X3 [Leptidea sinapis]